MKHTPEPWIWQKRDKANRDVLGREEGPNGRLVQVAQCETDEDAKRIVLCVNACAGAARADLVAAEEDADARQPCGHSILHEQSVDGRQADGQDASAEWCEICEEQIAPIVAERDAALERVKEIEGEIDGRQDHIQRLESTVAKLAGLLAEARHAGGTTNPESERCRDWERRRDATLASLPAASAEEKTDG